MTGPKTLSGDLANLRLGQLLRLVGAAGATGRLLVESGGDRVELAVARGRVARPEPAELRAIARLLEAPSGRFRFERDPDLEPEGETVALASLEELAVVAGDRTVLASDMGVDELLEASLSGREPEPALPIHHLPSGTPEDPLETLMEDLWDAAPEDLELAQAGVVAADPRLWRGGAETRWRERGWELRLLRGPEAPLDGLDLLVVHHQLSITRVGSEDDWVALMRRAREGGIPVVWVGPLADARWVGRLVEAGVDFLLPPPAGDIGEPAERFHEVLAVVAERLLECRARRATETGEPLAGLAEVLFAGESPESAVAAVLQMASRVLTRAAIVRVEPTVFRSWAGYGYPMEMGSRALPRGIALLERVARGGEAVLELDQPGQGRRQVARLLGVEALPDATCLIPLGARGRSVALLIGDREGNPLDGIEELLKVAPRLGLLLEELSFGSAS